MLNNFFANIGKDFACAIPNVEMSPLDFLKTPSCNSFIISPTTVEEIETKSYWSFSCTCHYSQNLKTALTVCRYNFAKTT